MNVIQNTLGCMYSANQTLLLWFFFVFDPNVCFLYSQSVMMITRMANWNDKGFGHPPSLVMMNLRTYSLHDPQFHTFCTCMYVFSVHEFSIGLMVIICPFSCQPDNKNANMSALAISSSS